MRPIFSTNSTGFAFKASFAFFMSCLCHRVLLLDINYSERCIFSAASSKRLEAGSAPY
jgi:hypothetical protein